MAFFLLPGMTGGGNAGTGGLIDRPAEVNDSIAPGPKKSPSWLGRPSGDDKKKEREHRIDRIERLKRTDAEERKMKSALPIGQAPGGELPAYAWGSYERRDWGPFKKESLGRGTLRLVGETLTHPGHAPKPPTPGHTPEHTPEHPPTHQPSHPPTPGHGSGPAASEVTKSGDHDKPLEAHSLDELHKQLDTIHQQIAQLRDQLKQAESEVHAELSKEPDFHKIRPLADVARENTARMQGQQVGHDPSKGPIQYPWSEALMTLSPTQSRVQNLRKEIGDLEYKAATIRNRIRQLKGESPIAPPNKPLDVARGSSFLQPKSYSWPGPGPKMQDEPAVKQAYKKHLIRGLRGTQAASEQLQRTNLCLLLK